MIEGKGTVGSIYISSERNTETNELIKIVMNGRTLDPNNFKNDFIEKLQYVVCESLVDRNYKLMNEINSKLSELKKT